MTARRARRVGLRAEPGIGPRSDSRRAWPVYGEVVAEPGRVPWAHLADVVLAGALCAVGIYELLVSPLADDVVQGPRTLNVAAVALSTLPLAWRRLAPLPVAVTIAVVIGVRALVADPLEVYPLTFAALIAVYSVAVSGGVWGAASALALMVASIEIAAARGTGGDAAPDPVATPIVLAVVWAVGGVAGFRHARARSIERGAAERDRCRAELTAAAVAAERTHIARELHDSVSHSLAMIAMQAGGAAAILAQDPGRAGQSLDAIERAAREGLTEMRRLLGLMGDPEGEDDERGPLPGLDRVAELLDGARAAGLVASLSCEGEARGVPAAVDSSGYRIIQESLTNAARHAGRCQVTVGLRWTEHALELEIANVVAATSRPADGHVGRGLIGMRERALLVGGQFQAGLDGGLFRVHATLPLGPDR